MLSFPFGLRRRRCIQYGRAELRHVHPSIHSSFIHSFNVIHSLLLLLRLITQSLTHSINQPILTSTFFFRTSIKKQKRVPKTSETKETKEKKRKRKKKKRKGHTCTTHLAYRARIFHHELRYSKVAISIRLRYDTLL